MNKKWLHHAWTKLRAVSYWYFLAGFIAFSGLFVYAYRQNNLDMIELRDAVFKADEENGDVEGALRELRAYVYSHMNTKLASGPTAIRPPIQLKHTYERLAQAEKDRVAAANQALRQEATAICEQRFPVTANVTGREPCIQGILNERGAKEQPIPKELYQFDFVSPRWAPDRAGWSLVLAALFGLLFITRFGMELWLRRQLQEQA